MSIESISHRFRIYPPTNKEGYNEWLLNMAEKMQTALQRTIENGGNCNAELESLQDAMDNKGGDLLQELERCELWLQNHWDDK